MKLINLLTFVTPCGLEIVSRCILKKKKKKKENRNHRFGNTGGREEDPY